MKSHLYWRMFEDGTEIAGKKDEEQGCGLGGVPDSFEACGGNEADQPAEEGAAEECDHQAEYAGGEEVEQRVAPEGSWQQESGKRGNQVKRRHGVRKHAQKVGEFGGGVSGAVNGLVRQDHTLQRVDEAVSGFRKLNHQEQNGREAEKRGEVSTCVGD